MEDILSVIINQLEWKTIILCLSINKLFYVICYSPARWKQLLSQHFEGKFSTSNYYETFKTFVVLKQYQKNMIFAYEKNSLILGLNGLVTFPNKIGTLTHLNSIQSTCNFHEFIPNEIFQLCNLTVLSFSYNNIKLIPTNIGVLVNLVYLHLNNNKIENIPTEIGMLVNLRILSLQHNQINQCPTELGNAKLLTYLDLSQNKINMLPSELGKLNKLMQLYLHIIK
jgi:hypothetical protein